jgi:hypothetical protein
VIIRSFWLVTHKDTHSLQRIRAVHTWLTETTKASSNCLCLDGTAGRSGKAHCA